MSVMWGGGGCVRVCACVCVCFHRCTTYEFVDVCARLPQCLYKGRGAEGDDVGAVFTTGLQLSPDDSDLLSKVTRSKPVRCNDDDSDHQSAMFSPWGVVTERRL